ncbi:hypothetical protein V1506DRAFT_547695, partial [Lipomyces tetrasporus]
RLDAIRIAGDFQRQLMERWRCRDDNCTNKNKFCFPEPTDPSQQMLQQRVFDQIEALEEKQERREERNQRRQMQREQREYFLQNQIYPDYLMQPQLPLHSRGQMPYTVVWHTDLPGSPG